MITRIVAVLLCLSGAAELCLADGFVPGRKSTVSNSDTPRPANLKSLEIGPYKLQAAEIEMRVTRDDQYFMKLKGDVELVCGQTRFAADELMISCQGEREQRILLEGHVMIQNERDQLQMTAQVATLINKDRYLTLQSRDAGQVTLRRTQDQQTTQIKAAHLLLKYKDLHTLLIKPIDQINVQTWPEVSADRVEVASIESSPFDFFDGVAVTEVRILGGDSAVEAKKP